VYLVFVGVDVEVIGVVVVLLDFIFEYVVVVMCGEVVVDGECLWFGCLFYFGIGCCDF